MNARCKHVYVNLISVLFYWYVIGRTKKVRIGMIGEEDPTCKMSHVLVASSLISDDMHFSHSRTTSQTAHTCAAETRPDTTNLREKWESGLGAYLSAAAATDLNAKRMTERVTQRVAMGAPGTIYKVRNKRPAAGISTPWSAPLRHV